MEVFSLNQSEYINCPARLAFDYDSGLCFLDDHSPIVMSAVRGHWMVSAKAVLALGYKLYPMSSMLFAEHIYGEPDARGVSTSIDALYKPSLLAISFDKVDTRPAPVPFSTYFILNTVNKAIKIGKSKTPDARFKTLNASGADPLRLLYVHKENIESALHAKFKAHRIKGEWFTGHEDIYAEIQKLQQAAEDEKRN